jgi:lipopolysaccharide biosynthesis glycosyltransferase
MPPMTGTRSAICLCADARMMIPAMFVAKSVLSMSPRHGAPFDVFIFCEPSQVTDLQRDWIRENGIRLRTDVDMSAYRGLFDPDYRLSPATLIRLFLPAMLEDAYDRILYLDADLTIHDDVARIFALDLGDHAFAAVRSGVVFPKGEPERRDAERHFAELGMTRPYRYFNSGVLLIDVRKWLDRKITENALAFVRTFPEKCRLVDEDALNATVDGDFCAISSVWNLATPKTPKRAAASEISPVIVHHMGLGKPWRPLIRGRHLPASLYYYGLYRSFLRGAPWEAWLRAQWSLREVTKYAEWEISNAVRSISRRAQRRAYADAVKRYRESERFADVEQGIVVRENGLLRLRAAP